MNIEDMEKRLRVYILDSLVSQSGKQLNPDVIGQITSELTARIIELMALDDVNNKK